MGLYGFLYLAGGVGPGVRSILTIADPCDDILATGRDCFVNCGRSEFLGVQWDF